MSADNMVIIKNEDFDHGPFATDHDAIADATRELSFIEYGFEWEEE